MSAFLDRLNLRPQERRYVVVVAAVVFFMLNFWFVWPRFNLLGLAQKKLASSRKQLANYQSEVARIQEYKDKLEKLKGEGSDVLTADKSIQFQRIVQDVAMSNHVAVTTWGQATPVRGSNLNTNYFEELNMQIVVSTGESELVDFLYNLGTGGSMIRVRNMTLNPGQGDPRAGGSTNLNVTLTLVASYQKKADNKTKTDVKPKAEMPSSFVVGRKP